MESKPHAKEKIAVIFCKDFPEAVRRAGCQEPLFPETFVSVVEGFVNWTADECRTVLPERFERFVDAKVASGYTVTAYVRLRELQAFVPFTDEAEKLAAANETILGTPRPEGQSNRAPLN